MTTQVLAAVEIYFPNLALLEEDIAIIVKYLRSDMEVDNLSIHNDKMTFHLRAKTRIDYGILDRIKEELKKMRHSNFVISAIEFKQSDGGYYYKDNTPT